MIILSKVLCWLFGHKKMFNYFDTEPWKDGSKVAWFCERCSYYHLVRDDA
jgi:hypothetical protein